MIIDMDFRAGGGTVGARVRADAWVHRGGPMDQIVGDGMRAYVAGRAVDGTSGIRVEGGKGGENVEAQDLRGPVAWFGGMVGRSEPRIGKGVWVSRRGLGPSSVSRGEEVVGGIFMSIVGEGRDSSGVETARVTDLGRSCEVGVIVIAKEKTSIQWANEAI